MNELTESNDPFISHLEDESCQAQNVKQLNQVNTLTPDVILSLDVFGRHLLESFQVDGDAPRLRLLFRRNQARLIVQVHRLHRSRHDV